jgi:hypothetical protein
MNTISALLQRIIPISRPTADEEFLIDFENTLIPESVFAEYIGGDYCGRYAAREILNTLS